jgi:hypothetical protein
MRTVARSWVVWITCVGDSNDHAVTDVDMAVGMRAGNGLYLAVCGASVLVASLTAPPGRRCARCVAKLRDVVRPSAPAARGSADGHGALNRPGALTRLLGLVGISGLAARLSRPSVRGETGGELPPSPTPPISPRPNTT